MRDTKNIPTLKPESFQHMITAEHEHWQKKGFNQFFIHDVTGYEHRLKLPFIPHRKTVHDLLFITKGSVVRTADIDSHKVNKGIAFITASGRIRSTEKVSANVAGFYCHFSDDFIAEAAQKFDTLSFFNDIQSPLIKIPAKEQVVITNLLTRMNEVFYSTSNKDLLQAYLIALLTELRLLVNTKQKKSIAAAELLTLSFKKLVSQNIKESNSVEDYAAMLHISPNHLNKSVKQTTGKTASAIVIELRILEAKVLLCKPSISISEVAYLTGFEDPSYFGRFFRKHTGSTPSQYRSMIDLSD